MSKVQIDNLQAPLQFFDSLNLRVSKAPECLLASGIGHDLTQDLGEEMIFSLAM